jgi:hypothetical protein
MYLSRVAAHDADMSWRSKPATLCTSAILPTSDAAALIP